MDSYLILIDGACLTSCARDLLRRIGHISGIMAAEIDQGVPVIPM